MITPSQCRAGRALLKWTHADLAAASDLSVSTVQLFEAGERNSVTVTLKSLRLALEAAGVVFIEENGGGPGARLREPEKKEAATRKRK